METRSMTKQLSVFFGIITAVDFIYGMFYYKTFDTFGLGPFAISKLMAIASLSLLLFDFPSGNVSDIIGRKRSSGIGLLIWGIGLIAFSLSSSFIEFMISIIIFNLGVALNSGSLMSWLHSYLEDKGELHQWKYIVSKIFYRSDIIKFILNAIVIVSFSFISFNILLLSGLVLIVTGLYILYWKKDEDNYGFRHINIFNAIWENSKYIIFNNTMRNIMIIKFLSGIFLTSFLLIYPYRLINYFGFSNNILPYLYFIFNFTIMLTSYVYSRYIINNFKLENIYIFNLIVGVSSIIIFTFTTSLPLFIVGLFLFEIFFTINITSFKTIEFDLYPTKRKAALASAIGSIGSLSSSVFFIVIGLLLDYEDYMYLLILLLLLTLYVLISKIRLLRINH
ncbi:MAG: MFS transporter [Bacilli bacterium]